MSLGVSLISAIQVTKTLAPEFIDLMSEAIPVELSEDIVSNLCSWAEGPIVRQALTTKWKPAFEKCLSEYISKTKVASMNTVDTSNPNFKIDKNTLPLLASCNLSELDQVATKYLNFGKGQMDVLPLTSDSLDLQSVLNRIDEYEDGLVLECLQHSVENAKP